MANHSDFTMADVEQIFNIVDQLHDVEIEFQSGDIRLWVKKSSAASAPSAHRTPSVEAKANVADSSVGDVPQKEATAPPSVPTKAANHVPTGAVEVKSPMLGRFFAAPSPTDPPFVTVGQQVRSGDTVALLEVMKLFNTVTADCSGRVVDIRVGNGEMVEFGQTLFVIQPD